ncbi:MAG: hypothetical protein IPJ34_16400 [Myxococcales bacterium]|nr:hypothetical protein [Myxococcales bacterium]
MASKITALLAATSLVVACSGEAPAEEAARDAGPADPAPPGPPPRLLWASSLYGYSTPKVATDGDGNVYVGDGTYPLPPACKPDDSSTVTKLDPSGKQLWVRCFPMSLADLAVGRGGRIVVATVGSLDFVDVHGLDGEGVERWVWHGRTGGVNPIARVAVGPLGHVIAAVGAAPMDRPAERKIRVQQFLPDGTPGWVRGLDDGYILEALASDDAGSYFVGAEGPAGKYVGTGGPEEIAWWKLDSTGVPRLTRHLPGSYLVQLAADDRFLFQVSVAGKKTEVRAFDATTGVDAWQVDLPKADYGGCAIAAAGEGRLVVVTSQPGAVSWVKVLASLDLFDDRGKKVWSTWHPTHSPTGMDEESAPTSVAVAAGKVVVGGQFTGVVDFGAGSYGATRASFLARFEL